MENGKPEPKSERREKPDAGTVKQAERKVRVYFILDEIARRENISVDDKELDETIQLLAKEYGKTKDELLEYYRKNNILEGVRDQLKEGKVMEFLIKNSKSV